MPREPEPSVVAGRRLRNTWLAGSRSRPSSAPPEEVVRHHVAMQSQDYGPGSWSIGQRSPGLVADDVDRALEEGSIVRTHVLRPTWHFVAREDVRWLLALTGPRVLRATEARRRELGLDPTTLLRSERVILRALEDGPRTREELSAALAVSRIDPAGQRLPHILSHAELTAAICSGGRRGTRHTFAAFDERVPPDATPFDRASALIELARRFLGSHGPASLDDLAWWASLRLADVRSALRDLGEEVRGEDVGDTHLWALATEPTRMPRVAGGCLLQAFDEVIVGYRASRYLGDPMAERARAAWSDRSYPLGIVLSDGLVAGMWRRRSGRKELGAEIHPFEGGPPLDPAALTAEADRLARFVGLPVRVSMLPPRSAT